MICFRFIIQSADMLRTEWHGCIPAHTAVKHTLPSSELLRDILSETPMIKEWLEDAQNV